MKILKTGFAIALVLFCTSGYANTFKLTDADVNNITRLCAGGSTESEVSGNIKTALSFWKQEVKAQGQIKRDEVSTILSRVKDENNLTQLMPGHQTCVQNVLFKIMDSAAKNEVVLKDTNSASASQNSVKFSEPKCGNLDYGYGCYVLATSQNKDTNFCFKPLESRVISGGEVLNFQQGVVGGKGIWANNRNEISTSLIEGIPTKLGMTVNEQKIGEYQNIDLLELKTCVHKSIKIKRFATSGKSSDTYEIAEY